MSSWQIRKIKHVLDSAKQDADVLIVQTTVASTQTRHTILVGSCAEGLDSLRYKRFCDKVPKSTSPVDPQSLPLTSAAAKYHSLLVHYKVMV